MKESEEGAFIREIPDRSRSVHRMSPFNGQEGGRVCKKAQETVNQRAENTEKIIHGAQNHSYNFVYILLDSCW